MHSVSSFAKATANPFPCSRFDPNAKKLQHLDRMTFNACATIDEYKVKPLKPRLVGNFRIFRAEDLSADSMNKLFSAAMSQEFKVYEEVSFPESILRLEPISSHSHAYS